MAASPELQNYVLGANGTVVPYTNYVSIDGKEYHGFDSGYPKFLHDPDVDNTSLDPSCTAVDPDDSGTYRCDGFLISSIRITITSGECNIGGHTVDPDDDYQDISEVGLFVSPTTTAGSIVSGDMSMFSRCCLSTIRKSIERELIFTWLIYF